MFSKNVTRNPLGGNSLFVSLVCATLCVSCVCVCVCVCVAGFVCGEFRRRHILSTDTLWVQVSCVAGPPKI
jgi:hypothetical protein